MSDRKQRSTFVRLASLAVGSACALSTCVAGRAFVLHVLDRPRVAERVLAAGPAGAPFLAILPERAWDTVCYLDPYDWTSRDLAQRHLREPLTGFAYRPYDRSLGEDELGLAFIDRASRTVHVYTIPRSFSMREDAVHEIRGPRCLSREIAAFRVQRVDALRRSCRVLLFVPTEGEDPCVAGCLLGPASPSATCPVTCTAG